MIHETDLQKLEKIIRKAVPGLMELTWGCQVYCKRLSPNKTIITEKQPGEEPWYMLYGFMNWHEEKELEIIGHPIWWRHVCLTINKINEETMDGAFVSPAPSGWMGTLCLVKDKTQIGNGFCFDLSKPLSKQKPEVIKWLLEVLGGGE